MKNTKEIKAILTAIFAINKTSEHEDKDISRILDYAFRRLFESNTNLLLLACIGKRNQIFRRKECAIAKLRITATRCATAKKAQKNMSATS